MVQAGDARVNVQPGLTAMHTVWHREHNWLAQKMKIAMTKAGMCAAAFTLLVQNNEESGERCNGLYT